jgi:hypothetical protein
VGRYSERLVQQLDKTLGDYEGLALYDASEDEAASEEGTKQVSTSRSSESVPLTRKRADTRLLNGQTAQTAFHSLVNSDDCESAEWVNCFLVC